MTITKNNLLRRVLASVFVLALLLTVLVSCGSKTTSTLTAKTINDKDMEEGCSLSRDQLDALAQMLAEANSSKMPLQTWLVAAYRGYDMSAEDFKDEGTVAQKEPDTAVAYKIIKNANLSLKDKSENKVQFLSDDGVSAINAADLLTLIKAFQTTPDLNAERGILDTVLGWIGTALNWTTNTICFGSYIFAICLFAVVIEIFMLPLSLKQHKTSLRQARLAPKEQAIRKKYAGRDDQVTRQKMSQELQDMYQKEGYSPASGCLPLLVQLPIILALYNIVIDPLNYVLGQASTLSSALSTFASTAKAAGGLGLTSSSSRGTITLLASLRNDSSLLNGIKDFLFFDNGEAIYERVSGIQIPNFNLGNINLGEVPSFGGNKILLLVPVLTFVIYFFSMRLTKKFTYQPANITAANDKQAACSSWMMDITMPLMSVYISFIVPALVGIYWMFKSVISTLRQFIVVKCIPYPKFTEDDYKAAEREYAGKTPKNSAPQTYSYSRNTKMVGGKPKSLFHMDDDEYAAEVEKESAKEEIAPKNGALDAAPLKDDSRDNSKKD